MGKLELEKTEVSIVNLALHKYNKRLFDYDEWDLETVVIS